MSKIFVRPRSLRLAILIAVVVGAVAVTYDVFRGGAVKQSLPLYIDSASDYASVRESLFAVVPSTFKRMAFDWYAKRINLPNRLKSGYYRVQEGENVIRLARILALGEQSPVHLVVGEARTLPQLAGRLAAQIDADSVALLKAMYDKPLRASLGYVKDSLIAMILPNTYQVWWSVTPEQLLRRFKRESDAFWSAERRAKAKSAGLTPYQVVTLASIVYEETKNVGEMAKIAGVYLNRLRKGMPLQACPTVKYAMGDFGLKRILHKHLKYRSPYNTYINRGLPPAPICIPSLAAIDAVLNHQKSDYLYFCAKPSFDGTHNFSRTLAEHNANAKKYAEALERQNGK